MGDNFLEVEHKYLVDESFDKMGFAARAKTLGPRENYFVEVADTYYCVSSLPGHVFRYRVDSKLQQLTVKSLGRDPEVRLEVNLDLDMTKPPQQEKVRAFLAPFGINWEGQIKKKVDVFLFPDCEVVYYDAAFGAKRVSCVEFEATNFKDVDSALAAISHYEKIFGFDTKKRCSVNLFRLLVGELNVTQR
jgi:hypothetical protein